MEAQPRRALALIALLALAAANGRPATDDFRVSGSESQAAVDLLEAHRPAIAGIDSQLIFSARSGRVTDAANRAAIERALAGVSRLRGVTAAPSPFDRPGLSRATARLRRRRCSTTSARARSTRPTAST